MKNFLAVFAGAVALLCFASCADNLPDLPTGDEQQLNHPATLGTRPTTDPYGVAPSADSLGPTPSGSSLGNPPPRDPSTPVPGEQ